MWPDVIGVGCVLSRGCRSLDVIANLQLQASGVEERRHFAHRIALDLFR